MRAPEQSAEAIVAKRCGESRAERKAEEPNPIRTRSDDHSQLEATGRIIKGLRAASLESWLKTI